MKCRHCGTELRLPLIDLGAAPPSNSYLSRAALSEPEKWYPLRVLVCDHCWLAQTEDYAHHSELFSNDYAYFSSYSTSWLAHAQAYVATMAERFSLTASSHVVEVASNDGYLLQYVRERGIPCLGIEPTASTAAAARGRGIEVIERFFGVALAEALVAEGRRADLVVANNVLAHVPDINDFVAGFARLLKDDGVATFEFPHLLNLVQFNQFDTIYHEHFSYLSLVAVKCIFEANGLNVFDVEELPTHGGSLRVFAQRMQTGQRPASPEVARLLAVEHAAGMAQPGFYSGFQAKAEKVKNDLVAFLIDARRNHSRIAAYGAAAKGNTLLNFAGIRSDLISYVVDRNPAKQGLFMPGSRIPIVDESRLQTERPDYLVILPWNLRQEVFSQLRSLHVGGTRFVTAVPRLEVA